MGRPERKKPLGRPRRRWEYNSKMDLQEVAWGETGLIWLRVGQVVGSCECRKEPSRSVKCGEFYAPLRTWARRSMLHRVLSVDATVRKIQ